MPLSYAKVISCSAICKHKGEGAWGGCTRARAESWCPVAGPMAVGGALPAGSRTVCRGARGALAGGHRPYLVRDLPSESHPCPCGGEKAHVEHGGCRGGQWAGGRATGGSVLSLTAPCPHRPPQLPWHSTRVPWPRFAPRHVAKHSRHAPFAFCYVGGRKSENHVGTSGHIAALLPARRKPPLIFVSDR